MTADRILFDALVSWPLIWAGAALLAALLVFAAFRGLSGWWLRALGGAVLLLALANPSLQTEERETLSDIALVIEDRSASQTIAARPAQMDTAAAQLDAALAARPNTEVRRVVVGDGDENTGTLMMGALAQAMADLPDDRLAGVFLLTDGQAHDAELQPAVPAPLHVLLTGEPQDWDRRLAVRNAPAFGILGEEVSLRLRVEDQGAVPEDVMGMAELQISVDGNPAVSVQVPTGRDLELPITLAHGGLNVVQITVPEAQGELTTRNNSAVVQINGVRDRLRVLLVSGEPHPGERTWRNLLKSDSSVDLVHFTILRPPEKQDGVPVSELSLIAFPTRELFLDKIDEFDLIIFDRYKRRGILPGLYLDNIARYVEEGGAVLIAAGPDFASADSLFHSGIASVLPAAPTARVIEEGFRPAITELGQRHPVTEGLDTPFLDGEGPPEWGRWFRLVDLEPIGGSEVMEGIDGRPLLMLDRVGEGRVALLASDHAWLWSRGFEGGGPQLELLRRLAHWMMKEPELEEEALWAEANGQEMTIVRRTLGEEVGPVEITTPDGSSVSVTLEQVAPGRYEATYLGPDMGLYRLTEADLESVIALGPAAPREFEETIASAAPLAAQVAATNGGAVALSEGMPGLRNVRAGRPAAGRGWLGLTPREAYLTTDVRVAPLLPGWLFLMLAALLAVGAWLYEGRRARREA
ncbi:hypothetical protein [Pseudoruegeria sp. SHC-113]|uniref:hypothetical protein n=1 Tax=Pseudoruegeria sp. SHC-113 TaxID=2855439 RepID=UPI0021BBACB3|nr:hypothetical protein [Pseudoruegeria sp. SHC-113]MCT8159262.1 hypothetical protein [Pseudoruegeria sp. SHC-113]